MAKINYIEFIDALKKLYDEKQATLKFSADGIEFGVSNKFEDWLISKNVDIETVKDEVSHKILILTGTIFDILSDKEPKRAIKPIFIEENYSDVVQHINAVFIDDKLKKKFLFEKTVKNLVISELNWEILTKKFDSGIEKKINNLTTALLKISLEDKLNSEDANKSVIIELSEEDIDHLTEQFKKIKENFKNGDANNT